MRFTLQSKYKMLHIQPVTITLSTYIKTSHVNLDPWSFLFAAVWSYLLEQVKVRLGVLHKNRLALSEMGLNTKTHSTYCQIYFLVNWFCTHCTHLADFEGVKLLNQVSQHVAFVHINSSWEIWNCRWQLSALNNNSALEHNLCRNISTNHCLCGNTVRGFDIKRTFLYLYFTRKVCYGHSNFL